MKLRWQRPAASVLVATACITAEILMAWGSDKLAQPRALTAEQKHTIADKMATWSKIPRTALKQAVTIFTINNTYEAGRLASDIAEALGPNRAGWDINLARTNMGIEFNAVKGVLLVTSPNMRANKIAQELMASLKSNGIDTFIAATKWGAGTECAGSKPNDRMDLQKFCSTILVEVGDHP